jgi:SAM-dependent methyltransferase
VTVADHDWNARYADGNLPWDTGNPDEHLVAAVAGGAVTPGRTLEIGCGTGTNALWLAAHGADVLGVDLSPLAIDKARAKAAAAGAAARTCRFEILDFLAAEPPGAPFDFVFDRGCLHVFDDDAVRARFAARVAALLAPGGVWLSLIGSTEGPPRDSGPPRRTAREVMAAFEPVLEVVELRAIYFEALIETPAKAWFVRARRRDVPAQPSTRR